MSITENGIDFNRLEEETFAACMATGRETVRKQLEAWDAELAAGRDQKAYRHKGKRKTVIKTRMGEVEYKRAVYELKGGGGAKRFVYLLDEAMGIKGSGKMSGALAGFIAEAVCEGTYRRAARSVSEMTGQSISHAAAWDVAQELGRRVDAREARAAALAAVGRGTGRIEAKVLFEEQDGIWLHLQGKSRKEHGKSKEMKVAIAYDGTERDGKSRHRLTNKVAAAGFEGAEEFRRRKEGKIAEAYWADGIEARVMGGDGAAWVRGGAGEEGVFFQLDPFHRNRAVLEAVKDAGARAKILGMIYAKKTDSALALIGEMAGAAEDAGEKRKLKGLLAYLSSNKDGLVGWHRRGLGLPDPPEGKEYRRLGTMESNIFTIIGNRMKGGRACWSVDGGDNLARLLALKHTGKLGGTLEALAPWALSSRQAEEILAGERSAAKVPQSEGKGYEPPRGGAGPATPDHKFLRGLGRNKPVFC